MLVTPARPNPSHGDEPWPRLFPGGYGLFWDVASDSYTIRLTERFHSSEKPIAMVCHAPAILRDAKKPNGEPLVKGLTVTGFMNAEDDELGLSRHLLFSLEDMLKERGAGAVAGTGRHTLSVMVS